MANIPDTWEITAATAPKPKPPRKPEEVWYDVHKHPEGVPGGMGKSPEHHLRNRGWSGHEINEGSGKKTIRYHNQQHPDFVISYGGGSGTKPDHNFRVLYMGTNTNIPKVTRAYSVAEAMNKVEDLHQLHNGLVVQPMTHDSATAVKPVTPPSQQKQPAMKPTVAPKAVAAPKAAPKPVAPPKVPQTPASPQRNMNVADSYPQFPSHPQGTSGAWNDRHEKQQLKEIPDPPPIKPHDPVTVKVSVFERAKRATWEEA